MKKLISTLVAMAMILSLCGTAMAAIGTTGTDTSSTGGCTPATIETLNVTTSSGTTTLVATGKVTVADDSDNWAGGTVTVQIFTEGNAKLSRGTYDITKDGTAGNTGDEEWTVTITDTSTNMPGNAKYYIKAYNAGAGTGETDGHVSRADFELDASGNMLQEYTITFDTNGGSGSAPAAVTGAAAFNLPAGTGLTKTGNQFRGWATNADGTGKVGNAGESYTPTADDTLYAIWKADATLVYDLNGKTLSSGTAPTDAGSRAADDEVTLSTASLAASTDGYTFVGWADADDSTTKITKKTLSAGTNTVYAIWQQNPNSWTTEPAAQTVTYGDTSKTIGGVPAHTGTTTYTVGDATVLTVGADGKITVLKGGTSTTVKVKVEATGYGDLEKTVTITTQKAEITGVPEFTEVTEAGKTLADVMTAAGCATLAGVNSETPAGTFAWVDGDGNALADSTSVVQGTAYAWKFTPTGTDADKYETKTGTVTPWPKAGGSGIVIGGSKQTYTVTYNVGSHGNFSSDASTTEKVAKNETPKNVPVVHPHDNYRFMGWTLDGKTVVDPTTQKITKNMTFTALYEACDHMAYMVGRSDTQFAPNGNLTRAEAATILSRLTEGFDENGTYPAAPYSDLNTAAWYAKYVNFAASKGIVNGRPDGTFDPDASITRAEFATMIANFAGVGRVEAPSASNDVAGHWAAGYIVALERANIVTGYEDGTFRPNANITRAEAATMVNGAIDRTPDTALDLAANSYTNPFTDVTAGQWFFAQVMEATVNHVTAHFHTEK